MCVFGRLERLTRRESENGGEKKGRGVKRVMSLCLLSLNRKRQRSQIQSTPSAVRKKHIQYYLPFSLIGGEIHASSN